MIDLTFKCMLSASAMDGGKHWCTVTLKPEDADVKGEIQLAWPWTKEGRLFETGKTYMVKIEETKEGP